MSCIKVLTLTTTYFVMSTHKLTYNVYRTLQRKKRKKKGWDDNNIIQKEHPLKLLINAGTKIIMLT